MVTVMLSLGLTVPVVQRDGAGLHGDSSDLLILPAVQVPQLTGQHVTNTH